MTPQVSMGTGLQRRLLLLLLLPLLLVALINVWYDVRLADIATNQQDKQLALLAPQLADSIAGIGLDKVPVIVLMSPVVSEFLVARRDASAYAVLNNDGHVLMGEEWLSIYPPQSHEPEFSTEEHLGVTYRIVTQRVSTAAGELAIRIADGSDPRQQWIHGLWLKVVWPNVLLAIAGIFAINWAVRRALRPLLELKDAVEGRAPGDLSPLDAQGSPDEVLPLVQSINRLFDLVNAQAASQRRFVADAAHQLRTPLAGLQSQVEAWAQALEGQSQITLSADQVLKLRHATRRTSQLAHQLLALSRADARSSDAQPSQLVDLKLLCESTLEEYLDAAANKGIDLGLDAHVALVQGHEWLLRELLGNLVDNAIRYTPRGGHVTLRCGIAGEAYLEVEDNGPGVPAAERNRMPERFYRVPGTPGEGNGLGLAIADEIARVHGSRLHIEAGTAGRGLRVSLRVPVRE
jgi:two-component system sensor histidine kinase TctE